MKGRASRRYVLTIALSGLCLALAVLAFVPPPQPAPEPIRRLVAAPAVNGNAAGTVIPRVARDGPAFQRPIFLPSRRLPGGGGIAVVGLKLRAVFLGPGTKKALLETGGTEPVWVTTGQDVGGWQVVEIKAESVVLTGRNGRRTLELEKPDAEPVTRQARTSPKPK